MRVSEHPREQKKKNTLFRFIPTRYRESFELRSSTRESAYNPFEFLRANFLSLSMQIIPNVTYFKTYLE